jgi:hypothetical protein
MLISLTGYVPQQNVGDFKDACVIARLTKKGKRNPADPNNKKGNFPLPYDQSETAKTLSVEHICKSSITRIQAAANIGFVQLSHLPCRIFSTAFSQIPMILVVRHLLKCSTNQIWDCKLASYHDSIAFGRNKAIHYRATGREFLLFELFGTSLTSSRLALPELMRG